MNTVARRNGVPTSLLFAWRKQIRAEMGFGAPPEPPDPPRRDPPRFLPLAVATEASASTLELELAGGARSRVTGAIDADIRCGMNGLALQIQETLKLNPHTGHLFVFRGKRGDLLKAIWHDGQGAFLFSKRLDKGRFQWPNAPRAVT